jgi:feruloyl esterase
MKQLLIVVFIPILHLSGATCDSLSRLAISDGTITAVQEVAAGTFAPTPDLQGRGNGRGGNFTNLPAFCRVAATLRPSSDSDIKIEVWLPVNNWNGNFQAVGNGGWAGNLSYPAMGLALAGGYATASTDTGHTGGSASFALEHPERVTDYAYRSEHEMTLEAKSLIAAFYGRGPKYSYWNGCSTGGKQGLTEAQRYPNDFDGIVAGASANYMIHLHAAQTAMAQAIHKSTDSFIPAEKFAAIHKAVLEACDGLDGVTDGVLENPRACKFDPKVIECKGADNTNCLTAPQVESARAILAPVKNPKTGAIVFPGLEPGSELGWGAVAGPRPIDIPMQTFKFVIFRDADWNYMTFDLARDVEFADRADNGANNAINPDLRPFFSHHGKLLMYHGWADNQISPNNSVDYYSNVLKTVGPPSKDSIRLFMVPGMGHCGGGDGTDQFDRMRALSRWVEKDNAPEQMIASHQTAGKTDKTRPLCAYPKVAKYKGTGSTDDAANFSCRAQ